jgi:hypothetical protein
MRVCECIYIHMKFHIVYMGNKNEMFFTLFIFKEGSRDYISTIILRA